jgi:hypothetical protein
MANYFEWIGGHIVAEFGGRTAINTNVPMLNLVPGAAITLTAYAISWPDFWKGAIFEQTRVGPNIFGNYDFGCSTWASPVEQEWGPVGVGAGLFDYDLPDIAIGSVPSGTDYLEIWVYLTRTVIPAKILDITLASSFPAGQWVKLDGHSCVVEEFGGVSRQFEFVLSGTNVSLRRTQSVNAVGGLLPYHKTRANPAAALGNQTFFYAGTNAPEDGSKYANYGEKIDEKFSANNARTHRPAGKEAGSSNNVPCSMDMSGISYASTWTGDIIIKPGRIGA